MAGKSKQADEKPATTPEEENTGADATVPTEPTPTPDEKKPKKGKVEVAADAKAEPADEAEQRLADARDQAVNNHARAQR